MTPVAEPQPPANVVFVYRDGGRQSVDCVYRGQVDGIHRWAVLVAPVVLERLASVSVDTLPAKTSIAVELADDNA